MNAHIFQTLEKSHGANIAIQKVEELNRNSKAFTFHQ